MRVLLMVFVLAGWGQIAAAEMMAGQITVTGRGVVARQPDMAVITLGVTQQAKKADRAMSDMSDTMEVVLKRLQQAGIAEWDIQTSELSLSPNWSNATSAREPWISGYSASTLITLRVRNLTNLGSIFDSAIASGATRFQGLQFTLKDPKPDLDEARRRAVHDAMQQAALYAEAAGVALGPVVSIRDGAGGVSQPMRMDLMRTGAGVPVASGEVSTEASVTMEFAIGG